jgi:hypothetical protein
MMNSIYTITRRPNRFLQEPQAQTPRIPGRSPWTIFSGVDICKHLDVLDVADLLACIHINERGHVTILQRLAR